MSHSEHPQTPQLPQQWDTAAWALMLATARGADVIHNGGALTITSDPLTMKRLGTLFPVARDVYEKKAREKAIPQSRRIEEIIVHCQKYIRTMKSLCKELRTYFEQRAVAVEPWARQKCKNEARKLPFRSSLVALRPAPPDAIGLCMIPPSPVWRLIRNAIVGNMASVDLDLHNAYYEGVRNAVYHRGIDPIAWKPLHNVPFVCEVYARAPPLIGVLPPLWTAADTTDELLEAMQALLQVPGTRPLALLVNKLTEREYDFLVDEHSCLSQILDTGRWTARCAYGRNVDQYKSFAGFLMQDGKGSLADVPPKLQTAKRKNPKRTCRRVRPWSKLGELSNNVILSAVASPATSELKVLHSDSGRWNNDGCKRQQSDDSSRGTRRPNMDCPSESPTGFKRRRLQNGAQPVQSATANAYPVSGSQRTANDGELPAQENREHGWEYDRELVGLDKFPGPLDPDSSVSSDAELINDLGHDPTVLAAIDRGEWLQTIPPSQIEIKPEQRELRGVEVLAHRDGARAAASALTALGLILVFVALVFRMRARRSSGFFSRSHAVHAEHQQEVNV